MIPLHAVALAFLILGAARAVLIAFDAVFRPQHMWIMNAVWPLTALYATLIAVWGYLRYGRLTTRDNAERAMRRGEEMPSRAKTPFPIMVATATAHCGGGCCLGDIIAEWLAFGAPVVAIWFGYQSLFAEKMFAVWILDYIFAFTLGIAFQYFTIVPMRKLSFREGLLAALKADALSLTAWQIGMYGFMAFAHFYLFRRVLRAPLAVDSVEFWFMMQIAMIAGFATSYPVNWWLLRLGIKERM
jgi:hypothetical protein